MAINEMDLKEWASHPVTKHFQREMLEKRQETMEAWAARQYNGAEENAGALGFVAAMAQASNLIDEWRSLEVPEKE